MIKSAFRIALTCAPGGENHVGNQLIGKPPVKGTGFTAKDIDDIGDYVSKMESELPIQMEVLDLNQISNTMSVQKLTTNEEDHAKVIILRNWISEDNIQKINLECMKDEWDRKYLDPNKYREEIVDGKKVRIRGRVMNKHARQNLCYAPGMSQEPNYLEGKGRIVDLNTTEALKDEFEKLICVLKAAVEQPEKVDLNVIEGNLYNDEKKTGIGFHGDTERVMVICMSLGNMNNYPMTWKWYKNAKPVGEPIDVKLNVGDVYIMSEKAVGTDWKFRSRYTLRHAAGGDKFRAIKKGVASPTDAIKKGVAPPTDANK